MPRGEHGALHHENVGARLLRDGRTPLGMARHGRHRARRSGRLDLLDALTDQPVLHRRGVDLLQDGVDLLRRRGGDITNNIRTVLYTSLLPDAEDHREPTQAALPDSNTPFNVTLLDT